MGGNGHGRGNGIGIGNGRATEPKGSLLFGNYDLQMWLHWLTWIGEKGKKKRKKKGTVELTGGFNGVWDGGKGEGRLFPTSR